MDIDKEKNNQEKENQAKHPANKQSKKSASEVSSQHTASPPPPTELTENVVAEKHPPQSPDTFIKTKPQTFDSESKEQEPNKAPENSTIEQTDTEQDLKKDTTDTKTNEQPENPKNITDQDIKNHLLNKYKNTNIYIPDKNCPINDLQHRLNSIGIEIRFNLRKNLLEVKSKDLTNNKWEAITNSLESTIYIEVQKPLPCNIFDNKNISNPIKMPFQSFKHAFQALWLIKQEDPFKTYLENLHKNNTWDKKARLNNLLSDFFEIPEQYKKLAEWCIKSIFIAVIRRTFHPGTKHDEMVIFKGPQGIGKSTFLEHLVPNPDYFCQTITFSDQTARFIEKIMGVSIAEIQELSGFRKTEIEKMKALISTAKDRDRLAYAHFAKFYNRTVIFVGTTNDDNPIPDDITGNRRYVLISLKKNKESVQKMVEKIKKIRDQLWAEGMQLFKEEKSARLPENLWDISAQIAEEHRSGDASFEQAFMKAIYKDNGATQEILKEVNIPDILKKLKNDGWIRDISKSYQMKAGGLLKKWGFIKQSKRFSGKSTKVWIAPEKLPEVETAKATKKATESAKTHTPPENKEVETAKAKEKSEKLDDYPF